MPAHFEDPKPAVMSALLVGNFALCILECTVAGALLRVAGGLTLLVQYHVKPLLLLLLLQFDAYNQNIKNKEIRSKM